ncbi:TPA: hypothetical protein KNR75_003786 [Clostridioides difficile]|nr:hypothetical protein [Clostridioides difficile]
MQKKIKIYLNPNSNCDDLCLELLEKLDEVEEGQALEVIAPANPFTVSNVKLKSRVAKKLLKLRVKFIVRIDCNDRDR